MQAIYLIGLFPVVEFCCVRNFLTRGWRKASVRFENFFDAAFTLGSIFIYGSFSSDKAFRILN